MKPRGLQSNYDIHTKFLKTSNIALDLDTLHMNSKYCLAFYWNRNKMQHNLID